MITITFYKIKVAVSTIIFFTMFIILDFSPFTLLPIAAATLHEFGHLIAVKICGLHINKVTFYPFGVDIKTSGETHSYYSEIFIKSSGIAVNLLLFFISANLKNNIYINFFGICNLILAFINVMPIRTLDGGSVLENILLIFLSPDSAYLIVDICSFVFILILWVISMYILMYTGYNFTLFAMCIFLFSTIFLKNS